MGKISPQGRTNRKEEILDAAERLMREQGVGDATTRAIAQEVPCSEGAIYVHFQDRLDLILAVLYRSLPEMLVPLRLLESQVSSSTPQKNLEVATQGLLLFHARVAPMLCSMLAESELLQRFQNSLQEASQGPDRRVATLGRYIEQEQSIGRISPGVKPLAAARVLMASSFFHAFTKPLTGSEGQT